MKTVNVSAFMLERYRLGELGREDRQAIDEVLASDEGLRGRLEALGESDRELRLRYSSDFPREFPFAPFRSARVRVVPGLRNHRHLVAGIGCAALVVAGIIVPVLYTRNLRADNSVISVARADVPAMTDRPKGLLDAGYELSLYLMGNQEIPLPDQTELQAGNTVQLAYSTPAEAEYYGVIFSVDGRSQVTLHYPYHKGQNPLLVSSGRRTFLSEAYTLDDAPEYEVFVMIISETPLDAESVLWKAQEEITKKVKTANGSSTGHNIITDTSKAAFADCAVTTVTVLKKRTL